MSDRYFLDAESQTLYSLTSPRTIELRNGGMVVAWRYSTTVTTFQPGMAAISEEKTVTFDAYQYEEQDGLEYLMRSQVPLGQEISYEHFLRLRDSL
ncbi:hypothetical protein [Bordetella trematum]|uniref:hypothetical protein n=1 Tax=Bordetella trematum TaxID=123899 RepID=UPI000D9088C9|nr:hypothetical protein [Bordetella trematum]SPU54093.1 Uncharacterised protein [Bordetella trematum]VDH06607.1 Uncharacterised protein [Bordetella trematum]